MIALVSDTTCGLSRDEATRLGVDLVPMGWIVDGTRHHERPMGENGDYAAQMNAARITSTEAVHTTTFEQVFRKHVERGDDVIALTISTRLSGTFRSAESAAKSIEAKAGDCGVKVVAVDSWSTAGGLELLLRRARKMADAGATVDEVVSDLMEARAAQQLVFSVADISALRLSGRLGAMRAAVGSRLGHFPIMRLEEGGIRDVSSSRGIVGMARALVAAVPTTAKQVVISHYGERGKPTAALLREVKGALPHANVRVKDGGPVLTNHLGQGAVTLAWSN